MRLRSFQENLVALNTEVVAPMETALSSELYATLHLKDLYRYNIETSKEGHQKIKDNMNRSTAALMSKTKELAEKSKSTKTKELIREFDAKWAAYIKGGSKVMQLVDEGNAAEAMKQMLQVESLAAEVDDVFIALVDLNIEEAKVVKAKGENSLTTGVFTTLLMILVSFIFSVFVIYISLSKQLICLSMKPPQLQPAATLIRNLR